MEIGIIGKGEIVVTKDVTAAAIGSGTVTHTILWVSAMHHLQAATSRVRLASGQHTTL